MTSRHTIELRVSLPERGSPRRRKLVASVRSKPHVRIILTISVRSAGQSDRFSACKGKSRPGVTPDGFSCDCRLWPAPVPPRLRKTPRSYFAAVARLLSSPESGVDLGIRHLLAWEGSRITSLFDAGPCGLLHSGNLSDTILRRHVPPGKVEAQTRMEEKVI